MVSRRILLALLCWCAPARAADWVGEGPVLLDGSQGRVLLRGRLGGAPCCAIGLRADLPDGAREVLVVAADGVLLALEPLGWRGRNGSRLSTRLSVVPDGVRLRLERSASAPRGGGFRREEWTDYLAWDGGAPLRDAPVRPVLPGTWQAALAEQREVVRSLLGVGLRCVPPALLDACPSPAAAIS